jgi:hypothetical protein
LAIDFTNGLNACETTPMLFNRCADVSIRKGWTDDCLFEIPCIQGIDPFSERPMKKIAHFFGWVENLLEGPAI